MPSFRSLRPCDKAVKALRLKLCAFSHQPLPIPSLLTGPLHAAAPSPLPQPCVGRQSSLSNTGTTHYQIQNLSTALPAASRGRPRVGPVHGPTWWRHSWSLSWGGPRLQPQFPLMPRERVSMWQRPMPLQLATLSFSALDQVAGTINTRQTEAA